MQLFRFIKFKACVAVILCFLGGHDFSPPVPEKSGSVLSSLSHPYLHITQSSSLSPFDVAMRGGRSGVYNWDQTVKVRCDDRVPPRGVLRYTSDGSLPEKDSAPFPAEGISLTDGDWLNLTVALVCDHGIVDNIYACERYEIDYGAYDGRFNLSSPEKGDFFSHDIPVQLSYSPVCGESFSLQAAVSSASASEELIRLDRNSCREQLRSRLVESRNFSSLCSPTNVSVSASVTAKGASSGGVLTRVTGRVLFSGRKGSVEKRADRIVVYPSLEIRRLDMHNRPAVTPYLWISSEPVVECDIVARDFFDRSVHPVDGAVCLFRVQYAEKNFPYGTAADRISWLRTPPAGGPLWGDPSPTDSDPSCRSVSGESLSVIDTEPFGWKGPKWNAPRRVIPSVHGRAYYQIRNPWDRFRIGEKDHYREIDDAAQTGRLDKYSFRTAVRFRVMAVKEGFRNSAVLHSFESDRCAAFDSSSQTRRYDAGTLSGSSVSDMEHFKSYPIEVFERPQGWTGWNHCARTGDGVKWFQKFGVVWTDRGRAGSTNRAADSVNRDFDPARRRALVFSHGFEIRQTYELLLSQCRTWDSNTLYNSNDSYEKETPDCRHGTASDYASWFASTASLGDPGYEWLAGRWLDRGYNIGYFHWNVMSRESDPQTMIPREAESKIWRPTGPFRMLCYADGDPDAVMADCVRSASIGMILAQSWLDAVPSDYSPETVTFTGHSLGAQIVMNASRKLVSSCEKGMISDALVPDRIDLLDPYWSSSNDYPGQTCRQYADEIRAWSISSGDIRSAEDAKTVPVQWFRTTALTQPFLEMGNDRNLPLMTSSNYLKLYLLHKYHGYVKDGGLKLPLAGWKLGEMSADAHSECIWWYFRSIERDLDARGSAESVSAATPVRSLAERIKSMRDSPSWRWFEMRGGQSGTGGGRTTVTTKDDLFDLRAEQSGQGDGRPEYN